MDNSLEVVKIIGLTIVGVVAINFMILRRFNRKNNNELHYWSKVLDQAKNPFKQENQDLDQLARMVEQSKEEKDQEKSSKE